MTAEQQIAAEQTARQAWESAVTKHDAMAARLAEATVRHNRAQTDAALIESRITGGDLGAAFSGDGVRIRGECDTFCARVKSLTQLSRILGGETERVHRAWQTCLADLWEPGRSGIYHAGVLREKAAAGVLCAGHRVCIADDGGETFHFDLAGGETPMERALRGRLVGDAVTVDAPGGAYQCRVIGVDAPCAA